MTSNLEGSQFSLCFCNYNNIRQVAAAFGGNRQSHTGLIFMITFKLAVIALLFIILTAAMLSISVGYTISHYCQYDFSFTLNIYL